MTLLNVSDIVNTGFILKKIAKWSAYLKVHSTIFLASNPFFQFEINPCDVGDLINRFKCQREQIGIKYSVVRLEWGGRFFKWAKPKRPKKEIIIFFT